MYTSCSQLCRSKREQSIGHNATASTTAMEAPPLHHAPVPTPMLAPPAPSQLHDDAVTAAEALQQAAAAAHARMIQNTPPAAEAAVGREQCPRCASGDTKVCYYNNFNTAQPRHCCH
uniref:Dof-type domain-containing protein n=1 Tax=Arundo donax TaxID=35708 RepID=A0A0A9D7M3_ARUDO